MKSIWYQLILLLFFSFSYYSHGQYYHGIEAGINYTIADFKINESSEPSGGIGFKIGYFAEQELNDNFYTRFSVNYNRRAFSAKNKRGINSSDEKWGVDVFEIPVNLGYYLNWNNRNLQYFVDAGVNIGHNSRVAVRNDEETIRLDIGSNGEIKRFTFGANASFGVLAKERIKLRLNYYHSLSSITNTPDNVWKNKTISISVNYFLKQRELVY